MGIYIHIPFCVSRCKYCDFYSTTLLPLQEQYIEMVCREIRERLYTTPATIYFGGGTPSLLPTPLLERILTTIGITTVQEITLEANPGDITIEKLQDWQRVGINRLSIGIQSFHDNFLRLLGRRHTAQQAIQSVQLAQQVGFNNISVDLMYALPNETLEDVQGDIDHLLDLHVQHISTYCLSYEQGTPFYQMLQRHELSEVDEEVCNEMYDTICSRLQKTGYEHYEVSNFALKGYHSQHNSSYWDFTPYIGIGAGAHSYDGKCCRRENVPDIQTYLSGKDYYTEEYLTDIDHYNEQVMLGLRTQQGIPSTLIDTNEEKRLCQQGLLRRLNNHLVVTQQGLHLLNQIIISLMR